MSYGRSVLVANGIEFQVWIQCTELVSFVRYCRQKLCSVHLILLSVIQVGHDRQEEMCSVLFFGYMQSRTIFVIVIDDASSCFLFWLLLSRTMCVFILGVFVCAKNLVLAYLVCRRQHSMRSGYAIKFLHLYKVWCIVKIYDRASDEIQHFVLSVFCVFVCMFSHRIQRSLET